MDYYKGKAQRGIDLMDIMVVLSLVNILYLYLKLVWFGTTGGTWFSLEPSTIIMPLVTGYVILHCCGKKNFVLTKFWFLIVLYLFYASLVTFLSFNYSLYGFLFAFIDITYWVCTLYLFYTYTFQRGMNNKIFQFAACLFVLLVVLFMHRFSFYKSFEDYADTTLLLNNVYYILFLLPFMLLSKKEFWQYLSFGAAFVAVVLSQKRGALIILAICFVLWVLLSQKNKSFSKKMKMLFWVFVFGTIACYFLSYITITYDLSVTERLMSLFNGEDQTGSGRSDIWMEYFQVLKNDGLLSIFGRGHVANDVSPEYSHLTWAHNDILQITFDYGYVGAIMFLGIAIGLFNKWREMQKSGYEYSLLFLISLLTAFINSIFSMCFIYPQWILMNVVLWGVLLGDFDRTRQKEDLRVRI